MIYKYICISLSALVLFFDRVLPLVNVAVAATTTIVDIHKNSVVCLRVVEGVFIILILIPYHYGVACRIVIIMCLRIKKNWIIVVRWGGELCRCP